MLEKGLEYSDATGTGRSAYHQTAPAAIPAKNTAATRRKKCMAELYRRRYGAAMSDIRILCRGHAAITATDSRALELIDGDEWANRDGAIGYDAKFDPAALDGLRGRVRVELSCGEAADRFEATISPLFHRGQPLLFRRDPSVRSRSFAFLASKTAADLSRELVEALRKPG